MFTKHWNWLFAVGMAALAVNPASATLIYTQTFEGPGNNTLWPLATGWSKLGTGGALTSSNGTLGGVTGNTTQPTVLLDSCGLQGDISVLALSNLGFLQNGATYGGSLDFGYMDSHGVASEMALVDLDNSNAVITSVDLTRDNLHPTPGGKYYYDPPTGYGTWGTLTMPSQTFTGTTGHRLGFIINASYNGYQEIDNLVVTSSFAAVPEPASTLSLLGLIGGAFLLRQRPRNK